MTTRKIIVTPCIVNTWLYVSASRKVPFGWASWTRSRSASMPPRRKKTNAVAPYRSPIRLWSTVVSHETSPVVDRGRRKKLARGTATVAISRRSSCYGCRPSPSFQAQQVGDDGLDLVLGEAQLLQARRHLGAGLDPRGVLEPPGQVALVELEDRPRERAPAGQVGQVGAHLAHRGLHAAYRVAADARTRREVLQALGLGGPARWDGGLGELVVYPGVELRLLLGDHPEPHVGVGQAAVLLAQAEVGARRGRLDVQRVRPSGDQVLLPGQPGDRERVVHVLRSQVDGHRAPGGDVDLVGGDHAEVGILDLPPPLVAGHVDLEDLALGPGGEVEDRPHGGDGHAGQEEGRQDRPRDLQAG